MRHHAEYVRHFSILIALKYLEFAEYLFEYWRELMRHFLSEQIQLDYSK